MLVRDFPWHSVLPGRNQVVKSPNLPVGDLFRGAIASPANGDDPYLLPKAVLFPIPNSPHAAQISWLDLVLGEHVGLHRPYHPELLLHLQETRGAIGLELLLLGLPTATEFA